MKKKKKKKTKIGLILFLVLLIAVLAFGLIYISDALEPLNEDDTYRNFTVEENSSGKKVLKDLEESSFLKNADIAYYYCRLKDIPLDFKAGDYEISSSMDIESLCDYLCDGSNAIAETFSLQFKEGESLVDYANVIASSSSFSEEDILAYWSDEEVLKELIEEYDILTEEILDEEIRYPLEGYLFPDTYEFFADASLSDITRKILDQSENHYEEYRALIPEEWTYHEVLTLASIIQRESGNSEDMKLISSVFRNRLEAGMMLQSSVTVCYVLGIGLGGDWTACEISQSRYDPYNTYQNTGLPPGPIDAPSENAILAAIQPESSDYYFFIGDVCGKGETIFAKTYEEQLINQERYLTCY